MTFVRTINRFVANNYKILTRKGEPVVITKADGIYLYDHKNKYDDLTSSYSAANLGHMNPYFTNVLTEQLNDIAICSRFVDNSYLNKFGKTVNKYFKSKITCLPTQNLQILPSLNGVDAFESSIKLARAWAYMQKCVKPNKARILFAENNFAGRTLTACSVSSYAYQQKFYPKLSGLDLVPYNDINAIERYIDKHNNIAAICLEPIQGEGGIIVPSANYLVKVRELCSKHHILLICDEIQTGLGRTGTMLCSEQSNIKPDIVLLGKSLGAGLLPVSVCIASEEIMNCIKPGEHGSTFGGYPLGSTIATEVLEYLHTSDIIKQVKNLSDDIQHKIYLLKDKYIFIKEVRGRGLLWGIEFYPEISANKVTEELVNYNIITKDTSHNTIRICPPFITTKEQLDDIFDRINQCFDNHFVVEFTYK
jgi:ornithine--oxo-acid transaminase